jgi:hypothetical protein
MRCNKSVTAANSNGMRCSANRARSSVDWSRCGWASTSILIVLGRRSSQNPLVPVRPIRPPMFEGRRKSLLLRPNHEPLLTGIISQLCQRVRRHSRQIEHRQTRPDYFGNMSWSHPRVFAARLGCPFSSCFSPD